ncbi:MAG: S8 family peptidase [Clostridia bacterium]|nr:S8 family peptidase [Clostridia bacterium]
MAKRSKQPPQLWERKIVIATSPEVEGMLLSMAKNGQCRLIKQLKLVDGYLCEFPTRAEGPMVLEDHPWVADVLDDPKITLIPPSSKLYSSAKSRVTQNWGIKKIQADEAWKITKGAGVKVAFLDTGVSLNHPDLRGGIKGGINILNPKSPPTDDNGHGTHVAGIIGARLNGFGVTGVAPESHLYAVKAFDSNGEANLSDIVEGMQWCLDQEIKLVNLSFGIRKDHRLLHSMVKKAASAGLLMVCAAGNEAKEGLEDSVLYPARYPETIAVSALTPDDDIADFSSRGPEVDYIAPGTDILSTAPKGRYDTKSGTSFAAPHVAGLLALLLGYGNTSYAKCAVEHSALRNVLTNTAQKLPLLTRDQQGHGLVNAVKAVSYLCRR